MLQVQCWLLPWSMVSRTFQNHTYTHLSGMWWCSGLNLIKVPREKRALYFGRNYPGKRLMLQLADRYVLGFVPKMTMRCAGARQHTVRIPAYTQSVVLDIHVLPYLVVWPVGSGRRDTFGMAFSWEKGKGFRSNSQGNIHFIGCLVSRSTAEIITNSPFGADSRQLWVACCWEPKYISAK